MSATVAGVLVFAEGGLIRLMISLLTWVRSQRQIIRLTGLILMAITSLKIADGLLEKKTSKTHELVADGLCSELSIERQAKLVVRMACKA